MDISWLLSPSVVRDHLLREPARIVRTLLLVALCAARLAAADDDDAPSPESGRDETPVLGGEGPPGPPRTIVDRVVFRDDGHQLGIEIPFGIPLEQGRQALRLHLLRGLAGGLTARLTADPAGLWTQALNLTRAAQEYEEGMRAFASRRSRSRPATPVPVVGPDVDWTALLASGAFPPITLTEVERRAGDPRRRGDDPEWPLTLTLREDQLEGSVGFGFDPASLAESRDPGADHDDAAEPKPEKHSPLRFILHIEAHLVGDRVEGAWKVAGDGARADQGAIAGVVRRGAGGATDPWPAGAEVHWQYGRADSEQRIGLGAAPAAWAPALTTSARLAWLSLDALPGGSHRSDLRFPQSPGQPPLGGYCSPVLAHGVLYQAYYRVSGDDFADPRYRAQCRAKAERRVDGHRQDYESRHRLRADDVMVAIDATTGRTLWKTVLPSSGYSWSSMHKNGFGPTPAWLDGRLYWLGTSGLLTCIDAADGEPVWQTDIGMRSRHLRASMETQVIPRGSFCLGKRDFVKGLIAADGVVVTCDYQKWRDATGYHYARRNGLMGFSAADGRLLWHDPGILTGGFGNVPLLWRHQGRTDVVVVDGDGARCLELATGRQVWFDPRPRSYGVLGHSGLDGDVLLSDAGEGNERSAAVGAFRLSPTGVEPLWMTTFGTSECSGPKLVLDGRGYFVARRGSEGALMCVDLRDGTPIGTPAPFRGGLSPEHDNGFILGGDGMLFTSNGRELPGLNAFRLIARGVEALPDLRVEMTPGYATAIRPIIADGRLIVRMHDRLACFDLRQPR